MLFNKPYDSSIKIKAHINMVQDVLNESIIPDLYCRALNHDSSRLISPEKEQNDILMGRLDLLPEDSEEAEEVKKEIEEGPMSHHYMLSPHHPEHYGSDVSQMSLMDIVEMFADWVAESREYGTDFLDDLKKYQEKYKYSDELNLILENTYLQMFCKEKNI